MQFLNLGAGVTIRDCNSGEIEKMKNENVAFSDFLREKFKDEKIDCKTVMEGIGSSILFGNLAKANVDGVTYVPDSVGVQMCHYLLKYGLFYFKLYFVYFYLFCYFF